MSENPVHPRPRRLVDWINLTSAKKVHSLIDKVYKRKNLEMAWERVKENRGSGGVDGQSLELATGSAASGAEGGHLSTSAGSPTLDPEERQTRRVSHAWHTGDL